MRLLTLFFITSLSASSLLAGGETTSHEATETRELVWNIYATLYASKKMESQQKQSFQTITELNWSSKEVMVNSLIFLNEWGTQAPFPKAEALSEMIRMGKIPHYEVDRLADHVRNIYQQADSVGLPLFNLGQAEPKTFAHFLVMADKLDGTLDTHLELPDLNGLYHMMVDRGIPAAAIGFNFRDSDKWLDRRSVIKMEKLDRELPKSLHKLRRGKSSDAKKLEKVMAFVLKTIQPVPDGWETDYWQTPLETLLVGEGDCEDFAILFHSVATWLGVETEVVIGSCVRLTADGEQKREGHAWVVHQGQIIDPFRKNLGAFQYESKISFNARKATFVRPDPQLIRSQNLIASR